MAVSSSSPPPQLPPLRGMDSFYPASVVAASHVVRGDKTLTTRSPLYPRPLPSIPDTSPMPRSFLITVDRTDKALPFPPLSEQSTLSESPNPPITKRATTASLVAPRVHHRVLSSFMPRSNHDSSPLATLPVPKVFAALIVYLDWPDVYNLLCTCKCLHNSFDRMSLRDAVLARFVPSYAHCLRHRNMERYQDIQVSIHDLDLLLISQRVELHRYPMHALRTLTALLPTFEDKHTAKLVALTQAHSRFVLLLQSLIHSSSQPAPLEPEEIIRTKSRFSVVQPLRELTFPAPLAYHSQSSSETSSTSNESGTSPYGVLHSKKYKHKHSRSQPSAGYPNRSYGSSAKVQFAFSAALLSSLDKPFPHGSRPSASSLPSMMMSTNSSDDASRSFPKRRRLSIFGKNSLRKPPPPPEEPRTLKIYSNTWRRTVMRPDGAGLGHTRGASTGGWSDVDETGSLRRPHHRFGSTHGGVSSNSSLSSLGRDSPLSNSQSQSPLGGRSASRMTMRTSSPSSLHDLTFATNRTRAPILRVFVPTSEEDSEACERQLQDSGLWEHLSIGDVVCNFGYVPPSGDEGVDEEVEDVASPDGIMMRPRDPSGSRRSPSNSNRTSGSAGGDRKWLIFDGLYLVPYTPPDLLPLHDPLSLPSPFYYAHIMPTPSSSNPTFIVGRLPVCDDVPQLTLIHSSSKVPSPHSPKGYALVKKFAWTARIVRMQPSTQGIVAAASGALAFPSAVQSGPLDEQEIELGDGWYGEWILEYEGTKEGKQVLLDALSGKKLGKRTWEFVREKSGGGKIWLKLLPL